MEPESRQPLTEKPVSTHRTRCNLSPSLSVIVPAFNVEHYLAQCLDSLIFLDQAQAEIIVVDDGSTDETGQIATRYAKLHNHVRLISQANLGLSAARNVGIRAARGEYLGFVDGDDWVDSEMYPQLLKKARDAQADLVITDGYLFNHETSAVKPIQDQWVWERFRALNHATLSPKEHPDLFLLDTSACKRLYRRTFLDRLEFAFIPGRIFEDVPAHYKMLLNTNAVALHDRPLYYYRTNRPGRITARTDETLFHVFDIMANVMDELERGDADLPVWANYLWFQNWVLRWLRKQISEAHADEFDTRSIDVARRFPAGATDEFRRKFLHDAPALEFVTLQTSGDLSQSTLARPRSIHAQARAASVHH